MTALPVGRAELRREGRSGLLLLAFGTMVRALRSRSRSGSTRRWSTCASSSRWTRSWSAGSRAATRAIVTLEENVVAGGAGSAVSECLAAHGIERAVHHIGIPDRFIEHGSREDCLAMAGLDAAGIAAADGPPVAGAAGRARGRRRPVRAQPDHGPTRDAARRTTDGGRPGPRRLAAHPDQQGRHQGHLPPGARQGPLRRRAAHRRELQHVRGAAAQLQGHAHVALRRGAAPARARDLGRVVPRRCSPR